MWADRRNSSGPLFSRAGLLQLVREGFHEQSSAESRRPSRTDRRVRRPRERGRARRARRRMLSGKASHAVGRRPARTPGGDARSSGGSRPSRAKALHPRPARTREGAPRSPPRNSVRRESVARRDPPSRPALYVAPGADRASGGTTSRGRAPPPAHAFPSRVDLAQWRGDPGCMTWVGVPHPTPWRVAGAFAARLAEQGGAGLRWPDRRASGPRKTREGAWRSQTTPRLCGPGVPRSQGVKLNIAIRPRTSFEFRWTGLGVYNLLAVPPSIDTSGVRPQKESF